MRGAELLAGVDAAVLAAQPLAVDQQRAAVRDADAGAGEALERLAVEPLGRLALAQQRARTGEEAERPVGAVGLGDLRQPLERAGRALRLAGPRRPPRRGRPAATSGCRARAGPRRSARPRPAPRRSARGRCSGPRCPSRWRRARAPRRAAPPPAGEPRPAPAPRSPARASWPARWRRAGRRGCRSPPPRRPPPRPARSREASRPQKSSAWTRSSRAIGSTDSAPVRRASSTWRAVSSSQATSSPQSPGDVARQPQPAQLLLLGDGLLAERAQRGLQRRRSGGVALGDEEREPVEQQVARARGAAPTPRRGRRRRSRACRRRAPAGRPTGTPRTRRGRSRARASASSGSSRRAASSSSGGASRPRVVAKMICARSSCARALSSSSSGPACATASRLSAASGRTRLVLALRGHQRTPRPARRIGGQLGGALVEGRGRRHAATRPRRGRPSARARRRRPRRARPSPARGARRGGRDRSASVASASARWTRRRSSGAAPPYTADRTSGWRKRTCAPSSIRPASAAGAPAPASIPSAAAALQSSSGSPTGSAAATSSSRRDRLRQRLEPLLVARLDPAGQRGLAVAARSRPPARPASGRAAARAGRAGCRASRPRSDRARARRAGPS